MANTNLRLRCYHGKSKWCITAHHHVMCIKYVCITSKNVVHHLKCVVHLLSFFFCLS
jgi:hypothetical protein